MPNNDPGLQFTHGRKLHEDGSVSFACSQDRQSWPWVGLHPHHPILLQNLQYWTSVETGLERGTFDGTKWTALTWTLWTCGSANIGPITRGLSEIIEEGGKPQTRLTFFDAADALVCTMRCIGVEFRTRDFEAWREKAKNLAHAPMSFADFDFAPLEAVGCTGIGPALITPLQDSSSPTATALLTAENAFPPGHPYMSGSGDHVNATHLAEAARQFVHLVEGTAEGEPQLRISGGEMRFTHYVELDRPFQIELIERGTDQMTVQMTQAGKDCTTVTLQYAPA